MAGTKKILIVEDNADWRELLVIFIRKLGYEVIAAATGEDGVAQAFAARPGLVLMDLGLPQMSGDQATAQLKANPTTKDIPAGTSRNIFATLTNARSLWNNPQNCRRVKKSRATAFLLCRSLLQQLTT